MMRTKKEERKNDDPKSFRRTFERHRKLFTIGTTAGAGITVPYAAMAANAAIQGQTAPTFVWGLTTAAFLVAIPLTLFLMMRTR